MFFLDSSSVLLSQCPSLQTRADGTGWAEAVLGPQAHMVCGLSSYPPLECGLGACQGDLTTKSAGICPSVLRLQQILFKEKCLVFVVVLLLLLGVLLLCFPRILKILLSNNTKQPQEQNKSIKPYGLGYSLVEEHFLACVRPWLNL